MGQCLVYILQPFCSPFATLLQSICSLLTAPLQRPVSKGLQKSWNMLQMGAAKGLKKAWKKAWKRAEKGLKKRLKKGYKKTKETCNSAEKRLQNGCKRPVKGNKRPAKGLRNHNKCFIFLIYFYHRYWLRLTQSTFKIDMDGTKYCVKF